MLPQLFNDARRPDEEGGRSDARRVHRPSARDAPTRALLDHVLVEAYGTEMPLKHCRQHRRPRRPQPSSVQPHDKSIARRHAQGHREIRSRHHAECRRQHHPLELAAAQRRAPQRARQSRAQTRGRRAHRRAQHPPRRARPRQARAKEMARSPKTRPARERADPKTDGQIYRRRRSARRRPKKKRSWRCEGGRLGPPTKSSSTASARPEPIEALAGRPSSVCGWSLRRSPRLAAALSVSCASSHGSQIRSPRSNVRRLRSASMNPPGRLRRFRPPNASVAI